MLGIFAFTVVGLIITVIAVVLFFKWDGTDSPHIPHDPRNHR